MDDLPAAFVMGTETMMLPLILLVTVVFSWPVQAQMACGDRAQILDRLAAEYSEQRIGFGLADAGGVIEILAQADGRTWTIILSRADGSSCLLVTGEAWQQVKPVRGKGA